MKMLFLAAVLSIGIGTTSFAQLSGTPEEQILLMKKPLSLTDPQSAEILNLLKSRVKAMDSLRRAANGNVSSMMDQAMGLRNAEIARIKAILTPAQNTAYQQLQDNVRPKRYDRADGNGWVALPSVAQQVAHIQVSLSTDDEQTAKITSIYNRSAKKADSLMNSLNGNFGDYNSVREKLAPIDAEKIAQLKAVLSTEQNIAYQKQQDEAHARALQMQSNNNAVRP